MDASNQEEIKEAHADLVHTWTTVGRELEEAQQRALLHTSTADWLKDSVAPRVVETACQMREQRQEEQRQNELEKDQTQDRNRDRGRGGGRR
jgi:hypothetical protein